MEGALHHAPDLALIETALWDGRCCPLLDRHLARLEVGAATLGWKLDPSLPTAFIGPQGTPARLRLLLGPQGMTLETGAVPKPIALWRVGVATQRLASDDPWLRIKSTRRAAYDLARRTLPPDWDEAILLNERDEVCDGSITTVFFDRGAGMRTPPRSSGVLPGVLRAQMLADGVIEEPLAASDLPHVRLWVGNALRGLSPAVLV